jgi:hypothetical protein
MSGKSYDCEIDIRCDINGDGVCNNTDDDLFYDGFSEPECIE